MSVKKIIFNNNNLWGLLHFRGEVIKYYLSIGYQVILVAPPDESISSNDIPSGIKYIPVELERCGMNLKDDFLYWNTLRKIYKKEKPDYIFHYTIKPNIYGTLAAHCCGITSSAMIAGLGYVFSKSGLRNRLVQKLYKFALKFAENVLVLNISNYLFLLEHKIVSSRKLIFLKGGEGINLSQFKPSKNLVSSGKIVFLMIARLLYDKGYAQYVEAARIVRKKYPEVEFQLLGPIDSEHADAVKELRIRQDHRNGVINYLGYSSNVVPIIQNADCIVLPSFYNEGLSRVLMEALALEKPIITTDIPGCRETVEAGKNGYIVVPRDTESLIEAMSKFIELDEDERERMGKKSRERAEMFFDVKKVVAVYRNITDQAFKS